MCPSAPPGDPPGPVAETVQDARARPVRLRLRLLFGDGLMLGPGKADLLQAVRDTGSIAAAGRRMGMSYRRAWALVEEMNAAFAAPLIDSARGGAGGGGASLTPTGQEVLRLYRQTEAAAQEASRGPAAALTALLRQAPATRGEDGN